jgi:hypothetical protein
MGGACSSHGMNEKCTHHFKLKGRDHLVCLGTDDRIILKWILKEQVTTLWTEFVWLMIVPSGGLLWTRQWTFGFHKIQGISSLAGDYHPVEKDSAPLSCHHRILRILTTATTLALIKGSYKHQNLHVVIGMLQRILRNHVSHDLILTKVITFVSICKCSM